MTISAYTLQTTMDTIERGSLAFQYSESEIKQLIKVVGVGGGGGNAVGKMCTSGSVPGVSFLLCNTDAQALYHSPVEDKITIGPKVTGGLGAGAKPERAREAALESKDQIREALLAGETRMVFITAGMGGGTGTGAAPVVAEIAKSKNILTIAIVTKPFTFEGRKKALQAEKGLEKLKSNVDSLIVVPNDKLLQIIDRKTSMKDAFMIADDILRQGVQGISDLLIISGEVNIDFADLRNAMKDKGIAHLGVGRASGENRAEDAAKLAIQSPLLETTIDGATSVIYNVTGDKSLTLHEFDTASQIINQGADPDATIIMGRVIDETAGEDVIVTVIATGFEGERKVPKIETTTQEPQSTPFYERLSTRQETQSSSSDEPRIPDWLRKNGGSF